MEKRGCLHQCMSHELGRLSPLLRYRGAPVLLPVYITGMLAKNTTQINIHRRTVTACLMFKHNHSTRTDVLTHGIQVFKYLMNSNDFIIQLIITSRTWEKCITVGNEKIKDTHNLDVLKEIVYILHACYFIYLKLYLNTLTL